MPLSDAAADPPPESETEMDEDEYEYEEVEVEEEEDEIEEEEEDEEWEEEDIDEAGAEVDEELVSSDVVDSRKDEDGETAENAEGLTLLNESNHKKPETDAGVEAVEGTENAVKLTKAIAEDNTKEAPDEKGAAEIAIGLTACKKEDNRKAQGLEEYAAEVAEGQAPTFINYHKEENGHILEPARLDKLLGSNSATPQEPLANPPLAFSVLGDNNDNYRTTCSNEANEGKEPTSDGNKALGDDVNISLNEGGVMHEKDFGCKTSAEILGVDITDHEAAVVEDMDISPRSDVPLSRSRSLPSGSECNDQNKRPAIVCDFFAKGWCIKGTSCRFLHVRDNAASSPKESRVDAKLKGIHEGLKDTTAISAKIVPSDPALAWIEREATLRSKSGEEVPVRRSDPLSATSLKVKDIVNDLEHKPYLANYSHSSSQTFGNGSFGKGLPSKSYQTDGVPTHLSHLEDIRSKGSQFKHDGSPVLQKIVEGGKERSVSGSVISLQNRSPLISGSEPDLISHAGVSAFTQRSYLYKPRLSFDHWEPSVPFRPSFLITRRMLSEASLYDPIRDCIEQTNALDKPSQSPLSGQGASALGTQKADPSLDPEQSPNKHSVSSHSSHQDTVWRNLTVKENEPKDTAGAPPEKIRTSLKGKQLLNDSNFRENTESEKARYSNHSVQKNGSKCKMELKAEKTNGQNNVDELVHQEPRKLFQTSLVEFIKQLLKPTWHLGLVSRDAYKVIVKKTADKALGALQTEHIPDNPESVKEYLSCVQPKLEKLVNGYVDKYGQL